MEVLKEDYTVEFMHFGKIIIPKGTRITHRTACGIDPDCNFVNEFGWIDRDYPEIANILKDDMMIRGVNVPSELIEESKG